MGTQDSTDSFEPDHEVWAAWLLMIFADIITWAAAITTFKHVAAASGPLAALAASLATVAGIVTLSAFALLHIINSIYPEGDA